MSRYLVVVESPAKAKTIKKYLGKEYQVKASVGHIKDLPKSKLGVDVEAGFKPEYEVISGKTKVLAEIKRAAAKADKIYLAPDPDREGEAIAWHIREELTSKRKKKKKAKAKKKTKKKKGKKKEAKKTKSAPVEEGEDDDDDDDEFDVTIPKSKVFRVLFNEVTPRAVREAIKHPQPLNENKYNSQQARRILDRLVGYQISPLLWRKVRRGLSAGRVQSVAVRLIVEREAEIKAFVPVEYWSLQARVEADKPPPFTVKLAKIDGKKAEIHDEATAKGIEKDVRAADLVVAAVERKERQRRAPTPFITSSLQQEASNRLRFTAKKTMTLSQRLYEGQEVGGDDGAVGLITYMRTDSTRLSNDAVADVRKFIEAEYGKESLPDKPNVFKSKKKTQDAHEAIRPTSTEYPPARVQSFLDRDMFRLYELIWKRFVACQMSPAVYDQTRVEVSADKYLLTATGSILKKAGWLGAYGERTEEDEDKKEKGEEEDLGTGKDLPDVVAGDEITLKKLLSEQHFTQPPPRFNEASLVKELEERGIGRPSTYASILSVIQDKEYVKKEDGRFHTTELGELVTELLVENFPNVMNAAFTANLEDLLDKVETGEADWQEVLGDFYTKFSKTLAAAEKNMRDVKREEKPTDLSCEKCDSPMVIKWGRNGRFIACSGYPDCKNTSDFKEVDGKIEIVRDEETDEKCPTCQRPMVIKRGRFGRFLACTGYPECKTSKPISVGVDCPECKTGYFSERRSKRGKVFYGCSNYPDCKNALWDRPINEPCPHCKRPFLLQKYTKKSGAFISCADKECGYQRSAEDLETG